MKKFEEFKLNEANGELIDKSYLEEFKKIVNNSELSQNEINKLKIK
jgi:hypothetical protein